MARCPWDVLEYPGCLQSCAWGWKEIHGMLEARAPASRPGRVLLIPGSARSGLPRTEDAAILRRIRAAHRAGTVIANVAAGAFCLPWGVLLVVSGLRRAGAAARSATGLPPRFLDDFAISPREADIIGLLVAGAANREISGKLFISPRTVEAHIYNVYRKCDCRNRVELVNRIQQYRPAP